MSSKFVEVKTLPQYERMVELDNIGLVWLIFITIVDFTLIIHFRHQLELGGLYLRVNRVINQLFCFEFFYLYKKYLNVVILDNFYYRDGAIKDVQVSTRRNPTDFDSYNDDYINGEIVLEAHCECDNLIVCTINIELWKISIFH